MQEKFYWLELHIMDPVEEIIEPLKFRSLDNIASR